MKWRPLLLHRRRVVAGVLAVVLVAGVAVYALTRGSSGRPAPGRAQPPAGWKRVPPEPLTSDGVPVLLTTGPERDAFVARLAGLLDVANAHPRRVAVFGTLVSATNGRLVVTESPFTARTEGGSVGSPGSYPSIGRAGRAVTAVLTKDTIVRVSAASPSDLAPGTPVVVGGERRGGTLVAQIVADASSFHQSSFRPLPVEAPSSPSLSPASISTPIAVTSPVSIRLATSSSTEDASSETDTVVLNGEDGFFKGFDPKVGFELGDPNGCPYLSATAEVLLDAHIEWHWPFQFVAEDDGFTVASLDRLPEAGGVWSFHGAYVNLFRDFANYSVYSGWGAAAGMDIQLGCKFFGAGGTWDAGGPSWSFAWQNETTHHAPLAGEDDVPVPPTMCPGVGLDIWVFFLGVSVCEDLTLEGGLFRATLNGSGGTPQGIAMPYAGHDAVAPATAPNGGPIRVDTFNYAPNLKVGLDIGVGSDPNDDPNTGDGSPEEESAPPGMPFDKRHPRQRGPTLVDGRWKDNHKKWFYADGTPGAPPGTPDEIAAANAVWIHPGQQGILPDGDWLNESGGWIHPNGQPLSNEEVSRITPAEIEAAKASPYKDARGSSDPEGHKHSRRWKIIVSLPLHWHVDTGQTVVTSEDIEPGELNLDLPTPVARASPPSAQPLPGKIVYSCSPSGSSICVMNPDGSDPHTVVPCGNPDTEAGCSHPALSPDGTKLAYEGGEGTLTIGDAQGGGTLVPEWVVPGCCLSPAWSPQGDRLALIDAGGSIRIVRADGTQLGLLTPEPGANAEDSLAWSPDGTEIVFVSSSGGIEAVPVSGGKARPILWAGTSAAPDAPDVVALSWTPGPKLLFEAAGPTGTMIEEVNADGTGLHPILPGAGDISPSYSSPSWGPDGIHFSAIRDGRVVIATVDQGVLDTVGPEGVSYARWGGPPIQSASGAPSPPPTPTTSADQGAAANVVRDFFTRLGHDDFTGAADLVEPSQRGCFLRDYTTFPVHITLTSVQIGPVIADGPDAASVQVELTGHATTPYGSPPYPSGAMRVVRGGSTWQVDYEHSVIFDPPCLT